MAATRTVVLITGANQGLGFECVKKLCAEQPGYHILMGARDPAKGEAAVKTVTEFAKDASVEVVEIDVTSDPSIEKAAKFVEAKFGKLDVLFNNAGVIRTGKQQAFRQEFQQVLDINTVSPACVTMAFAPLLQKSDHPRLLFMSSGLGSITLTLMPISPWYGMAPVPTYAASKAALNLVGAFFTQKYTKDGFRINMIDPGHRQTALNGFNPKGGKASEGAIEACRIITQGKNGQHGTFTSLESILPW
ncbi:putative carbonyl reductase [Exophiala viscosa]|uniref:Carbonyl reductase n=1 Tax=Exophiala viscosa TaxID=2486360 RepID=A0AAN6E0P7_9EURO|nr:putative carbonyl reductase [Exophiala viscosa]KAI1621846.1 putative carbonyl reductase [Exophiala viscosa]